MGPKLVMDQQLFTDGIGRISVIGGIVRLDLVTYSPNETDAQGKPRQVFTQRIVMGTEAFLRSAEKVRDIVEQLSRAGAPPQTPRTPSAQPTQKNASAVPVEPKPQAAPKGEPPYTSGPLFPPTPDTPPRSPFP